MTATTQATPTTKLMHLVPYVFFYGRCEEALEFYKKAIGGTYELQRNEGSPMCDEVPPAFAKKVMHATFNGPGITFMASDGREAKSINPKEGNIALALSATDSTEGQRVFKALSEGGEVIMPLSDAFWGGKFGMISDRFGNEWMITTP